MELPNFRPLRDRDDWPGFHVSFQCRIMNEINSLGELTPHLNMGRRDGREWSVCIELSGGTKGADPPHIFPNRLTSFP